MRALAVAFLAVQCALSLTIVSAPSALAADAPIDGSWVATCPEASMSGFILHAKCRDPGGTLRDATLDLLTCAQPATATNVNGQLACESGARHPPVGGSWSGSCADERLVGQQLTALCMDPTGVKRSASIDLATCVQPATAMNQNGRLVCENGLRVFTTTRTITLSPGIVGQPVTDGTRQVIVRTDPPAGMAVGTASPRPGQFGAGALPLLGGSWSATCTSPSLGLDLVFTAACKDAGGTIRQSSLRITDCAQPARIANANGQVVCENGPRGLPVGGSWSASCIEDSLSGSLLSATCMSSKGIAMVSSLDVSTCNAPASVGNRDGQLVCENGQRVTVADTSGGPGAIVSPPGPGASGFAGAWDIVSETGFRFVLFLNQAGQAITGNTQIENGLVRLEGALAGGASHAEVSWQLTAGSTTFGGDGTLDLSADGSAIRARLLREGTDVSGGSWSGVRQGSRAPVVTTRTLVLPNAATAAGGGDGFVMATVAQSVSVRTLPTMSGSDVLRSLPQGTEISVKCQGNWCQLATGNEWVARGFVRLHGAAAGLATTAAAGTTTTTVVAGTTTTMGTQQRVVMLNQQPAPTPGTIPCTERASATSSNSAEAVTLQFHNGSADSRTLNWINREGKSVFYGKIPAGLTKTQETFDRHMWELTNDAGACIMLFIAGAPNNQTVEVP